jgi:hypothetical protein
MDSVVNGIRAFEKSIVGSTYDLRVDVRPSTLSGAGLGLLPTKRFQIVARFKLLGCIGAIF